MVDELLDLTIRPATAGDARAIAEVHIDSLRHAYAGVVNEAHLAGLDQATYTATWSARIQDDPARTTILVATVDGALTGFAMLGPSRDEDAELGGLQIYFIFLEPDAWGHGVARELMRTVLAEAADGTSVTLWVLEANERARHFYRRHGFVPDGIERLEQIGDESYLEVRYRKN